jgi:hypothetical protein
VVTDAKGRIIRYLGPSDYPGTNPWPSFIPYTQSIYNANQTTHILRTNGFNFASPYNIPVYQFGADMTATANSDGSLTIAGSITASVNGPITTGNPALPSGGAWTGATFSFSVSDKDAFNNAIYGQIQNSAVSFTGQAWSDFQTFTQNTLQNPSQPHDPNKSDPNYNPSLDDLGAYNTTVSMFIGEVTAGLLGGFFNSNTPSNYPPDSGAALKNVPSMNWWLQNPIVAFSEIQPSNPYYNLYAKVIFNASHNTVYGVAYSDRFGSGPLVNSVSYNGTNVDHWVLGIGAPLAAPKTLSGMLLLLGNE